MTNINQEIADLKAKLEELEKKVADDDYLNEFVLYKHFYVLGSCGTVNSYVCSGDEFCQLIISCGNAFHTEAEAIRERDKRALLQELKVFRKGYRFVIGEGNSFIFYHHEYGRFMVNSNFEFADFMPLSGWFPSREEAERAIAHFGDRLNLLKE